MGKWKEENYNRLLNKVKNKLDKIEKHKKGFTSISNESLCANMPSTYYKVLCVLESFAYGNNDTCMPTNAYIAVLINRSIRTVQRATKYLKENGYIKIQRRFNSSNIFTLLKKVLLTKKKNIKYKEHIENIKQLNNIENNNIIESDYFDDMLKNYYLNNKDTSD